MNKYVIEYLDPILQHIKLFIVYAINEYDALALFRYSLLEKTY